MITWPVVASIFRESHELDRATASTGFRHQRVVRLGGAVLAAKGRTISATKPRQQHAMRRSRVTARITGGRDDRPPKIGEAQRRPHPPPQSCCLNAPSTAIRAASGPRGRSSVAIFTLARSWWCPAKSDKGALRGTLVDRSARVDVAAKDGGRDSAGLKTHDDANDRSRSPIARWPEVASLAMCVQRAGARPVVGGELAHARPRRPRGRERRSPPGLAVLGGVRC